ncbi:hypothetical protein [Microbispora sp. ATCC PTA-5024]|nr:hypothetical protein [Microbispora sp. ATCC PTA-5024]
MNGSPAIAIGGSDDRVEIWDHDAEVRAPAVTQDETAVIWEVTG